VDWINVVQDRYKRRAVVSTVMNFRVPQEPGICWVLKNDCASCSWFLNCIRPELN
jgi:hypothetical protein